MAKFYVVTGVPAGAQEAAARRGQQRHQRERLEGKVPHRSTKHRVRGQEVRTVSANLVDQTVSEFEERGLTVTVRRWRP